MPLNPSVQQELQSELTRTLAPWLLGKTVETVDKAAISDKVYEVLREITDRTYGPPWEIKAYPHETDPAYVRVEIEVNKLHPFGRIMSERFSNQEQEDEQRRGDCP